MGPTSSTTAHSITNLIEPQPIPQPVDPMSTLVLNFEHLDLTSPNSQSPTSPSPQPHRPSETNNRYARQTSLNFKKKDTATTKNSPSPHELFTRRELRKIIKQFSPEILPEKILEIPLPYMDLQGLQKKEK